jgi:sortase B
MNRPLKILSLVLAILLLFGLVACADTPEPIESSSTPESSLAVVPAQPEETAPGFLNPLPIPTAASPVGMVNTGFKEEVKAKYALNDEAIGWLNLPGTSLNDVVMFHPVAAETQEEKFYYLRRDFNKVPNTGPLASQYGSYFADWRTTFGGGRTGLARNTTIYGHSMSDDPNGDGFSPLKKYLTEDFARQTPYLYFSTQEEDMAWEVFAVFYATVYLPYNMAQFASDAEFVELIDECRARSIYNYDTEVTEKDKVITLSTCCYNLTDEYPNNYRYVVMAKLVKPGQKLAEQASFEVNPSPAEP